MGKIHIPFFPCFVSMKYLFLSAMDSTFWDGLLATVFPLLFSVLTFPSQFAGQFLHKWT